MLLTILKETSELAAVTTWQSIPLPNSLRRLFTTKQTENRTLRLHLHLLDIHGFGQFWIRSSAGRRDILLSILFFPAVSPASLLFSITGVKRHKRQGQHSYSSNAELNSGRSYTSIPPTCLQDLLSSSSKFAFDVEERNIFLCWPNVVSYT